MSQESPQRKSLLSKTSTAGLASKPDGRLVRGAATRERVLDAAERLFAERGFDGVSIRDIAEEAEVTLGVVGFHGGSKLDLFRTVLARRVVHLSAARSAALAEIRSNVAKRHDVSAIVRAYVSPYLKIAMGREPQWRAYAKLAAQIGHDERWYDLLHELYDHDASDYLGALGDALPDADPGRLAIAFTTCVAAMLSSAVSTARAEALSGERATALRNGGARSDFEDAIVDFCVGGLERATGRRR
jgi:AcrR family transcriptional regulator